MCVSAGISQAKGQRKKKISTCILFYPVFPERAANQKRWEKETCGVQFKVF